MRNFLALTLVLFSVALSAQVVLRGRVVDGENGQSVPFAGINVNDSRSGFTADADGVFEIRWNAPITHIYVRAFGYNRKRVEIDPATRDIVVRISTASDELNEVEVIAGENPLHKIIRKVIDHRDENNPTELDAFKYQTYSKVLFTIAIDSAMPDFDTAFAPLDTANPGSGWDTDSVQKVDSSGFFARQFASQQHIFMMESVTERKFKSPRDNERVLASRVSGLKTPLFVLISSEMQSFSFYDNYINILGSDRVSPIAPGAIGRYAYIPKDTLYEGSDTIFVIKYFPVKGHRFKGVDGELYITSNNWAVTEVIARPTHQDILGVVTDTSGTVFGVEIHQTYDLVEGHWFPREMMLNFRQFAQDDFGASTIAESNADVDLVGFGRTLIKNIEINPDLSRSDIDRVSVAVDYDATEKDDAFWYQYRGDSLDAREKRTYEFMDSVGQELDIERKIKWLMALTTGKLRWGYFDFNIDRIVRYNVYEGFRLGAGVQTSPKLSNWFSIGGHFGYGFKDKVWKYGYFGEIYLDKSTEATLYGGYDYDIYEIAGTSYKLQRKTIFGSSDYRFLNIPTFDEISDVYGGFRYRIWPNLQMDVSLHRQNRLTMSDYAYRYTDEQGDINLNGFNVLFARLELEYAPNDRYMSGPFGLRPIEITYPRFRLAYEESFDNVFDRSFPYHKINAEAAHQIKRVYTGITTLTLSGSYVSGDVPYTFLSGPQANGVGALSDFTFTNAISSARSFETMPFNQFAADAYVALDIRHSFEDRLFTIGSWAPKIDVLWRSTIGTLSNPELHTGFELQSLEHGYHEVGLEINELINGLGIGFYQRFGAYYSGAYGDNAAVKLTYRTSVF
ncbi:MAG: carboxypeptidase-like regulatory domain-containing protein [Bacteroidetes bacterium]|nr:MAG: carboxypeptidase-like regulatory domain-containing protein [Bacteroidota bacterium]